jgi:methyl-accepting chemotaxis protein
MLLYWRIKNMKNRNIKKSILIPSLAALVSGVIIMIVTVSVITANSTNDLTNQLISATVNESMNKFESLCNDGYAMVRTLAPMVEEVRIAAENPREEIHSLLEKVVMSDETILSVWTAWEPNAFDGNDSSYINADEYHDGTGRFVPYVYRDETGIKSAALADYDDPVAGMYYQGAKNSGKPYITDPYEYSFGGTVISVYSIAFPILNNGAVSGVVGMDINLERISAAMNEVSILEDGYICVLSPGGLIATHQNENMVLANYDVAWLKNYAAEIESMLLQGGTFSVNAYSDVTNSNVMFLGSGVRIGDTDGYWGICGFVPESTVNASANFLLIVIIGIGLVLIGTVGLIIYFVVSKITHSVKKSVLAMEEITEKVVAASKELDNSSGQIAESATEQAAGIQETSATMNETSSMIAQNAENTRNAALLARQSRDNAALGSKRMDDMINSMEELQESSGTIKRIIKTINDIASQTNLLAINATVEAARAGGEAGRSFAVVAGEVRALAQKTAAAANETADIIEKNAFLTNSGKAVSGEIADALKIIAKESEDLNTIISEIHAASEEQASGVKQINNAMSQMEKATQSNAAAAQQSSAAAVELSESSSALSDVTSALSAMV